MLDIFFQGNLFRQFINIIVYTNTYITAPARPVQYFLMLSLTPSDHRRQKLQSGPLRKSHHLIHHLIHCLLRNLPAALRTVRYTDPGIEKPEIIVYLCHCSHGGTRVAIGGFLVN